MKKTRLFLLFLALSMLLSTIPAVAGQPLITSPSPPLLTSSASSQDQNWLLPAVNPAPSFPDVEGTWCKDEVTVAFRVGLMEGKTSERFDIRSPLTYAQSTVIAARFHELLNGGDGILPDAADNEVWYRPAAEYLKANCDDSMLHTLLGYLELDPSRADKPCIRRDFIWMLAAVLPESTLSPFNDVSAVPDSVSDHILEFYRAGILNGVDEYGTFLEESPLSRGAACAILARIIDPDGRLSVSLKSLDLCRDILGVDPGTVLLTVENMNVTAEELAWQLCAALYGQSGNGKAAIQDAIFFWSQYEAPYHLLASNKKISLPADKLTAIADTAAQRDGYQGMTANYWKHQLEAAALNTVLLETYSAGDPKYGKHACADDLNAISTGLAQNAKATAALSQLDFTAVYQRILSSPWPDWVMLSP